MFVSLEGIDRSGKTTQAELLASELGADTVLVREPGGTPAAERVRELLKDPAIELDPLAELLLFCAARADLVARVIRPALDRGANVVCDRFADSSVAYQGGGRGLGAELAERLTAGATGGLEPDVTLLLRLDPDEATARQAEPDDRFEDEGLELQRSVAAAYDEIAAAAPQRVKVIDATGSVNEVHARVMSALEESR